MPTITLQDGTKVIISQESYDALAQAVKPKELTYEDVAYSLFVNKESFYPGAGGRIPSSFFDSTEQCVTDPDNAPTEQQVKQLLALNKLFNVAYYLNEGWVPDWKNGREYKYFMYYDEEYERISTPRYVSVHHVGGVYFKSEALAKRAITILGEKAIKECFGIFE